MSAAIAAIFAAVTVIFALAVTTTASQPIDTYLNLLLSFVQGRSLRVLDVNEAVSMLLYAALIYLITFSVVFFIVRAFSLLLVAFGLPDEQTLRLNRELRRNRGAHLALARRTGRYTGAFVARAQRAAARKRPKSDPLIPTLKDFDL